ncbi:MAG: beta-propeller domain-containing protein [Candidatus Aenigmarchaeota archaeon]|nr:beta-propeller domain-containing protein [Candidatus Aenigmarchaeota archaeon]
MSDEPVTIVDRDVLKVLSADTRVDILKALSEGKRMPSWVARKLGKSDATIVEHLKALEKAGLVHKTSAPGKRWVFYSLTDKGEGMVGRGNRRLVIVIALSILVVFAGASMFAHYSLPPGGIIGSDQLKRFSSYSELEAFVRDSSSSYGGVFGMSRTTTLGESAAAPAATSGATAQDANKADDHSQTNVQIAGVDEADIVKNDGRYIYVASGYGSAVAIVDAYPAETAKVVSNFTVDGTVSGLFVDGDRLVVIFNNYTYGPAPLTGIGAMIDIMPRYSGSSYTVVRTYDITDRANPAVVKESSVEGSYYDSRMIGSYVYLIAQKSIYYGGGSIAMPSVRTAGAERAVAASEIYYSPYQDSSYTFTTVLAENVQDASAAASTKTLLLGYSESMYVSPYSIYLVSQKRMDYKQVFDRIVDEVILPSVPADVQAKITVIRDSSSNVYDKENQIQQALQDYYGTLGPEEGAAVVSAMEARYQSVYAGIAKDYEKTVVHRIAIAGAEITYVASGEVPGTVLNQFSMDESADGHLRIATTSGQWAGTGSTTNNMYVLDPTLNVVGSLEDLAAGERIYSVRFIDNRAYMVTFRQIDPLFVIDLSDPQAPAVLGYLKVPGVSDYLHPYDDTHVIGVGREADAQGHVLGVKLSLFDATDVANPTEISKYVVSGDWSWSEASYEHKAFLFSRDKQLLVIPVQLTDNNGTDYTSWQGVYVFNVNLQDGITLKGRVTHANETAAQGKDMPYYYNPQVRRSLYIDNVLYTVSDSLVKANDLASLAEIITVQLPSSEPIYHVMGGTASGSAGVEVAVAAK